MIKAIKLVAVTALVASLAAGAGAQAKHHKGKAKAATCPVCHMALSSKKSASNPVGVRLTKHGKVMYCCAGCKMPKSVLIKGKK